MEQVEDCRYAAQDDVVARYLGGKLDPAAAEEFEAHFFACQRCWEEVEAAAAIQSAPVSRRLSPPSRRRSTRGVLLAAAASVALAVFILLPAPARRDPVQRSTPRGSFALSLAQTEQAIQVTWTAVEGAVTYRVDVMNAEGAVIASRESRSTTVEIPRSALDPAAAPPLYVRVQALEAPGSPIASAIEPLAPSR